MRWKTKITVSTPISFEYISIFSLTNLVTSKPYNSKPNLLFSKSTNKEDNERGFEI
jgi:hypothetical protein